MTDREFWWNHLRWQLLAFVVLATLCVCTSLDMLLAHVLFYDESTQTWLASNNWWVTHIIHTGGRWAMRGAVALALLTWVATFFNARLRPLRLASGYLWISMALSIGIVGLLKVMTNVDCPWDLTPFGGKFPVVGLFADRPDDLRRAQCFPAAHASSGYALMALYFVYVERDRTRARIGLTVGVLTGLIFGISQQARGAHFLSHDVWSAFLVWLILLSVYAFGLRPLLQAVTRTPAIGSASASRVRMVDFVD